MVERNLGRRDVTGDLTCGRSALLKFRTEPRMLSNNTLKCSAVLRRNVVILFMTNRTASEMSLGAYIAESRA